MCCTLNELKILYDSKCTKVGKLTETVIKFRQAANSGFGSTFSSCQSTLLMSNKGWWLA